MCVVLRWPTIWLLCSVRNGISADWIPLRGMHNVRTVYMSSRQRWTMVRCVVSFPFVIMSYAPTFWPWWSLWEGISPITNRGTTSNMYEGPTGCPMQITDVPTIAQLCRNLPSVLEYIRCIIHSRLISSTCPYHWQTCLIGDGQINRLPHTALWSRGWIFPALGAKLLCKFPS